MIYFKRDGKGWFMVFKKISPNLMVEDVAKAAGYYCDKLGFSFAIGVREKSQKAERSRKEGIALDWAMVRRGSVEVMFQSRRSMEEEGYEFSTPIIGGTLTLFIEVEGIDEIYESLQGRAQIVKDINTTFYGLKEFSIRDEEGYTLTFGERI